MAGCFLINQKGWELKKLSNAKKTWLFEFFGGDLRSFGKK